MNPLDWEDAVRKMQRHLDPNHQSGVNNSMENASITDEDWNAYGQYSGYTVDGPQSSMGVDVGWKGLSPPQHNIYIKESEVEDQDGEPLQLEEEEDTELSRKRNELRQIEEQILCKKVAIALKKVEPFVKETHPGFPCKEQPATCISATLKDRVNVLLQQRHTGSFLSKVRPPKERRNSFSLSRDGLLQEDHPLKLRVKALMKQRRSETCVLLNNREPPDVPPPPPSRSITSLAKGEHSVNQGFQRFLSVLNEGVDMDFLSRIVNDDSEDLPLSEELVNIQAPATESKSDSALRSKRQRSNSGASLPGHSQTNSGERKTDPHSQERSLSEGLSLADDDDRGRRCFGSSSRSKSPSTVQKKKEEDKPKVDEQHEQLQNILKTLGLSLEVEEMSKLADRTQERLYGKKHEGMRADSKEEQDSLQKGSHKQYRNSSSSSSRSSSSSSRSTSRSFSPNPSRRHHSHSRGSKQRRTSQHCSSRDRSRGRLRCKEGKQDSKDAQRDRDKDGKDSKETSTYQHPYPQNQTHPHPQPAAFSAFPVYSSPQYSQYNDYSSGTYSAASDSYWTATHGAIPPTPYYSAYPYPQNTYHHFPDSVVTPNMDDSHHNSLDINLYVNPDLSKSEGQLGSISGRRCLQVITTKQSSRQSCVKQLTNRPRTRRGGTVASRKRLRRERRKRKQERKKQKKLAVKQLEVSVKKVEAAQGDEEDSKAEQSEKRKQTLEEIKTNLRKKLDAFNQKAKQNVTEPANSLPSQTG